MNTHHLCLFEDRESEAETLADENFSLLSEERKVKSNSWHVPGEAEHGPNINLKYFKKKYCTEEEKHFMTAKIKSKKKTELCKNWEIYHDCYFKHECSFAHGIEELRINMLPSGGSKNVPCKTFKEKGYCLFGKRCNYRHVIKEGAMFTYESILNKTANELYSEMNKIENKDSTILQIYKRLLLNRKILM